MDEPVSTYGLLYLIRAYNRKEITLEEWLVLSREWAERMKRQYDKVEKSNASSNADETEKAS